MSGLHHVQHNRNVESHLTLTTSSDGVTALGLHEGGQNSQLLLSSNDNSTFSQLMAEAAGVPKGSGGGSAKRWDAEDDEAHAAAVQASTQAFMGMPTWMLIVNSVRSLHTNNGGPIRARIQQAVEAAQLQNYSDVAAELAATIAEGLYKSNAAGPTKKAAVGILMNRLPLGFEVPETIPQKPKVKTPEGIRDNNNNTSPLKLDVTRHVVERGSPSTWMEIIDSIRSMATNNGGPIRSKIKAGLNAAAGMPEVQHALGDTLREDLYKSNAAGPMKNLALNVLERFHPGYRFTPTLSRPNSNKAKRAAAAAMAGTSGNTFQLGMSGGMSSPNTAQMVMTGAAPALMDGMPDMSQALTITFRGIAHCFMGLSQDAVQCILNEAHTQVQRMTAQQAAHQSMLQTQQQQQQHQRNKQNQQQQQPQHQQQHQHQHQHQQQHHQQHVQHQHQHQQQQQQQMNVNKRKAHGGMDGVGQAHAGLLDLQLMSHPEQKMSHPRLEKMRSHEPDDDRLLEELAGDDSIAVEDVVNGVHDCDEDKEELTNMLRQHR